VHGLAITAADDLAAQPGGSFLMLRELTSDEFEFVSGGSGLFDVASVRQVNVSNIEQQANTRSGVAFASTVGGVNEATVNQSSGVTISQT
jgi:hypothetical protein